MPQPKTPGLELGGGAEEVMARKAELAERLREVNGLQAREVWRGRFGAGCDFFRVGCVYEKKWRP